MTIAELTHQAHANPEMFFEGCVLLAIVVVGGIVLPLGMLAAAAARRIWERQ
jgi:hypothetical protein